MRCLLILVWSVAAAFAFPTSPTAAPATARSTQTFNFVEVGTLDPVSNRKPRPQLVLQQLPSLPPVIFDPKTGGQPGNPGLQLLISTKGLNYASEFAGRLLNEKVRSATVPDISQNFDGGSAEAKNVRITDFNPPSYYYQLNPPNQVVWGLNGAKISAAGDWNGRKKVLFAPISGSGTFTATANDLTVSASANLKRGSAGQLALDNVQCNAKIAQLSLSIRGGFVGWVVSWFQGRISDQLKPILEQKICEQAVSFITNDAARILNNFPTSSPLNSDYSLDYKLVGEPLVSAGGLNASYAGAVLYKGVDGAGFYPNPLEKPGPFDTHMLYLWGSDYIVNSFLSQAQQHNLIRYVIDSQNLPEVAQYLATTCSDICLGSIFPEIGTRYPGAIGEIGLWTTEAPMIIFSSGKAILAGKGSVQLNVRQGSSKTKILDANFTAAADFHAVMNPNGDRVIGEVHIQELDLTVTDSAIKDIKDLDMNTLTAFLLPVIEEQANTYLKTGLALPTPQGIKFKNFRLRFLSRTLELAIDVS